MTHIFVAAKEKNVTQTHTHARTHTLHFTASSNRPRVEVNGLQRSRGAGWGQPPLKAGRGVNDTDVKHKLKNTTRQNTD